VVVHVITSIKVDFFWNKFIWHWYTHHVVTSPSSPLGQETVPSEEEDKWNCFTLWNYISIFCWLCVLKDLCQLVPTSHHRDSSVPLLLTLPSHPSDPSLPIFFDSNLIEVHCVCWIFHRRPYETIRIFDKFQVKRPPPTPSTNYEFVFDVVWWYWFYFTTPCFFENKPWWQFCMVTWPTLKIVLTWKIWKHVYSHLKSPAFRYQISEKTCLEDRFCNGVGGGRLPWNLSKILMVLYVHLCRLCIEIEMIWI
jgi:hypothetical protein